MLDPGTLAAGGLGAWFAMYVLGPMVKSASASIGQRVAVELERTYLSGEKRHDVGGPRELREGVRTGAIKEGSQITGTGYFSLHAPSGTPPLLQHGNMASAAISMAFSRQNSPMLLYPTTSYPLVEGGVRVAFIYPHDLWGFGELMIRRGRPEPCHEGVPLIVRTGDWVGLEDRIVRFRARLETIRPEDMELALGTFNQDLYDVLAREGRLAFLNAVPDGYNVTDFESPHQHENPLLGLNYLSAHWDPAKSSSRKDFVLAIQSAVHDACEELEIAEINGLPNQAQRDHGSITWFGPGIEVYQPTSGPVVHIQANADLRARTAEPRHNLNVFRRQIFTGLTDFESDQSNDLDATDTLVPGYTVLNSPEARAIQDPALRSLAEWLRRNHSSRPKGNDEGNA